MVSRLVFPEVLRYNTIGFTLYDMVRMTGQGHGLHPSPRNPAWVQTVRKWRELRWAVIQLECDKSVMAEADNHAPADLCCQSPEAPRHQEVAETGESYEVFVMKQDFKFHCAHFVTYPGFRERLHGHNYTVGVRMRGVRRGADGYLIDFGDIKKVTRSLCKELNERFLCPMESTAMAITVTEERQVELRCEDGAFFSFPEGDCALLPIEHSTTEELAAYMWFRILQSFGAERLLSRGITSLEIIVAEAPQQEATFRRPIARGVSDRWKKHLQSFASKPGPCLARSAPSTPTAKQSSSSSS